MIKPVYFYAAIATIILLVAVLVKVTLFTTGPAAPIPATPTVNATGPTAAAITDPADVRFDCPTGSPMPHPKKSPNLGGTIGCDGKLIPDANIQYTKRNTGRTY